MAWTPTMDELERTLLEAQESIDDGDPEGALALTARILESWSEDARAWHVRAVALADLGQLEAAMAAIRRSVSLDPELAEAAFFLADILLYGEGRPDEALDVCDRYLRKELADGLYGDFLNLKASARCEQREFRAALAVYERAAQLCPDREDPGGMGWCLFELGEFVRAEKALTVAVLGPGRHNPATHHYLGVTLERLGESQRAAKHFRIAARLDPNHFFVPPSIPEAEFAALVEAAMDELPEALRKPLDNVAVVVEPWPSLQDLEGFGLSPLIVGLCRGPSLMDRSTADPWGEGLVQIAIYQRNLEFTCMNAEEIVEQLTITLWHEVGHFLGLDEEDLHARGLG